MDLTSVRTVAVATQFAVLGVDATVTPLDEEAVSARVVWVGIVQEEYPVGRDLNRRDPRRILALQRSEVAELKRGSTIVAPAPGGTVTRTWKVDGIDRVDADQIRVVVTPVPES